MKTVTFKLKYLKFIVARCTSPATNPARAVLAFTLLFSSFLAVSLGYSSQAYAYDYGNSGSSYGSSAYGDRDRGSDFSDFGQDHRNDERLHILSIGAGVSAPSETVVNGENPAGLIYNRRPKLLALVRSGGKFDELLGDGAAFYAGNGLAAAMIGAETFSNTEDQNGSFSYFNFGLGTLIQPLNVAVGLNGSYRFQKKGTLPEPDQQVTWTTNAGLLVNPFGTLRLGFEVYDISQSISGYGFGGAAQINPFSTFSLDASMATGGRGLTVKPSIGVIAGSFQMMYGYGVHVDKDVNSYIRPGNTFGLGFEANSTFQIQAFYNQLSLYQFGATIKF